MAQTAETKDGQRKMKLSEAMHIGSRLRPQGFHGYFDFKDGEVVSSCALGAAYEGAIRRIQYGEGVVVSEELGRLYPFLGTLPASCPACIGTQVPLSKIITHLNDTHKWSRDHIADWLESIESSSPLTENQ